jgi:MYXO-CTERM domain-containing protein
MRRRAILVVSFAVTCLTVEAGAASAANVRGIVYADLDHDGVPSAGEPGLAGTVVAFGDRVFTRTDARGAYSITIPDGVNGQVWARVPDGYVPGPVWAAVRPPHGDHDIDLGMQPLPVGAAPTAVTFVVAADTHMQGPDKGSTTAELIAAIEQSTSTDPQPLFFTILGDITHGSETKQFYQVGEALQHLDVPWVPVPGNHDWVDKGASYRAKFGPENYSFDAGGVHFVVWNSTEDDDAMIAFLRTELSFVDPHMPIVALGHAPPHQVVIDAMVALGVDYLFCGHWHANRVMDHGGGLLELDTEPFIMGGMDFSPAGYRVVTIEGGRMTSAHGTVVDGPYARVVSPADGCTPPGGGALVVAADVGTGSVAVTATIDDVAPIALTYAGGWDWRAPLALGAGRHHVHVIAVGPAGATTADADLDVCDADPPNLHGGEWPGFQGGPTHAGLRADDLAPPLLTQWTATVGGHVHMGAPVVSRGRVYVTVSDFARGDHGGVVALDLDTGAELWRWTSPLPVRNAPAVADGTVVAAEDDGTVVALDAATGTQRWRYQLGVGIDSLQHTLWASPTIADGVVYVGVQRHFAALDLRTGEPVWQNDPVPKGDWHGTFASAAVGGGVVIDTFHRDLGGLIAWDQASGDPLWRVEGEPAEAVEASPVIVDDTVYVCNGKDEVRAVDVATGMIRWSAVLDSGGFDWGYAIAGTPAYADGRLFVATQYRDLVALDARTGVELWRHGAHMAPIHFTHYFSHSNGYLGSPLVTGRVVWIGAPDGTLTALDAASGAVIWERQLGAPVLSGLAVAGDYLIVAGYDGSVRALARPPGLSPRTGGEQGCGCTGGGAPGPGAALLALVTMARLRRRRAPVILAG